MIHLFVDKSDHHLRCKEMGVSQKEPCELRELWLDMGHGVSTNDVAQRVVYAQIVCPKN